MKKDITIETMPIDSTKLCCNFVNTQFAWKGEDQSDFFIDYPVFIDWCIRLSVYEKSYLNKLRTLAEREPEQAKRALRKIVKLRLLIHDFISAIANKNRNKQTSLLQEINPFMADALAHIRLEQIKGALVSTYQTEHSDLTSPVWVVLKSLYDLVTTGDVSRMKECPSCGWVFYDETKNGKRRWCNPLNCGTKDKMDRYTKKLRDQGNQ